MALFFAHHDERRQALITMKQIMQDYWSGDLRIEDVPDSSPKPGMVLVHNVFSAISSGTERAKVELAQKNLLGIAKKRPDDVKQVIANVKREGVLATFNKVVDRLQVPISLGYSSAGLTLQSDLFKSGTPVACIGEGYACHAEKISVPNGYVVEVPEKVGLDDAAFAGIGAIAMQGLRQTNPQLGESIGVIGLGLIGQLLVQALKAAGARVIGFDPDESRIKLALSLGMNAGCQINDPEQMKNLSLSLTKNVGLDAVVITAASGDSAPLKWAADLSREKGRVVILGALPIEIPREPYYQKELTVSLSRAFGPGSYDSSYIQGKDYPVSYVRWTAKRNMQAFLDLLADGKMNVKSLVTHRVPFENATEAYELLTNPEEKPLGLLLSYPPTSSTAPLKRLVMPSSRAADNKAATQVGFIGMGNFAQTYLMPHLKKNPQLHFVGVATSRGLTASHAAKKYRMDFATGDSNEIIQDEKTNAVLITTRHNSHANLVCESIQHGKKVYVEKPLALNLVELEKIHQIYMEKNGWLMVGFNRRFSPDVVELKKRLNDTSRPFQLTYRINAGLLAAEHWLQNAIEGGGRLRGEGCHFIDLAQYLIGRSPVSVQALCSPAPSDDFQITIRYQDGSLAFIHYLTGGDISFPRERVEIFGHGFSAAIDDFRELTWSSGLKTTRNRRWFKDMGYKNSVQALGSALTAGTESPTPYLGLYQSTLTTLKAFEALQTGHILSLEEFLPS